MSDPSTARGKRIIICCDGTWQSAVSGLKNSPSNVTRIARTLERIGVDKDGKTWDQVVFYDSGVGTTSSKIGKMHEGAIGAGLEGNVIEAYNFVALNYTPGDQIFCFGFSRGAYTARSIAGLISDIGICSPRDLNDFPDIWELYKKGKAGERFYGSDAWWEWLDGKPADEQPKDLGYRNENFIWEKRPHGDWAVCPESREIEVVGVYDTVGALGLPSILGYDVKLPFGPDKPGFHNVQLNRNIKRAFQALAIDEHREAFSPTLWRLPEAKAATEEEMERQRKAVEEASSAWYNIDSDAKASPQKRKDVKAAWNRARQTLIYMEESQRPPSELLQVWFPGVHINVGGGSSDTLKNEGDLEEMSNVTFAWMIDQIYPYLAINETTYNQEDTARQLYIEALNKEVYKYQQLVEAKKAAEAKKSWGSRAFSSVVGYTSSMNPFAAKEPDPQRRDYGWGTGTIIDSYTLMYKANGSEPRTPGAYVKDKATKQTVTGKTFEQVHPTVGYRMYMTRLAKDPRNKIANAKELEYNPLGLNKVKRRERKATGTDQTGWEYTFDGGVVLPEYVIPARTQCHNERSFERLAVKGESAWEYLKTLDQGNGIKEEF